jgi:hypothetical protein
VNDPGSEIGEAGGEPALEHVRRLDDVVVDAHEDQVFGLHVMNPHDRY